MLHGATRRYDENFGNIHSKTSTAESFLLKVH